MKHSPYTVDVAVNAPKVAPLRWELTTAENCSFFVVDAMNNLLQRKKTLQVLFGDRLVVEPGIVIKPCK